VIFAVTLNCKPAVAEQSRVHYYAQGELELDLKGAKMLWGGRPTIVEVGLPLGCAKAL